MQSTAQFKGKDPLRHDEKPISISDEAVSRISYLLARYKTDSEKAFMIDRYISGDSSALNRAIHKDLLQHLQKLTKSEVATECILAYHTSAMQMLEVAEKLSAAAPSASRVAGFPQTFNCYAISANRLKRGAELATKNWPEHAASLYSKAAIALKGAINQKSNEGAFDDALATYNDAKPILAQLNDKKMHGEFSELLEKVAIDYRTARQEKASPCENIYSSIDFVHKMTNTLYIAAEAAQLAEDYIRLNELEYLINSTHFSHYKYLKDKMKLLRPREKEPWLKRYIEPIKKMLRNI